MARNKGADEIVYGKGLDIGWLTNIDTAAIMVQVINVVRYGPTECLTGKIVNLIISGCWHQP